MTRPADIAAARGRLTLRLAIGDPVVVTERRRTAGSVWLDVRVRDVARTRLSADVALVTGHRADPSGAVVIPDISGWPGDRLVGELASVLFGATDALTAVADAA